jgi:signal transduction histidine kinase/CheY-like chemotaxis protein/HPt (histidine-containing phosphotransfer) domain-containing protein
VDVRSRDELGVLAAAFNEMAAALQGAVATRDKEIAARDRAEKDLRTARDAADAANHSKSVFLTKMSHEIRTPMNGIIGMTGLALETPLSPEQKEYLEMVNESAHSLMAVINNILDFSKIEAGKMELDRVEFRLRNSVEDVLSGLAVNANAKGLEILCRIAPDLPDCLRGDPVRLRQILTNLVGNATKFTREGEILVEAEKAAARDGRVGLQFTVRDTGIGFAPDKAQLIFRPFEQGDGSTSRQYGGTGLGLAICKELVEMMGGQIWVESEPGNGSAFHFTVAVEPGDPGDPGDPGELADPTPREVLAAMPVLVVDDNATNRRILNDLLRHWQMAPVLAGDGPSAIEAVKAARTVGRPFPLILVDACMPGMDGFELVERLREHTSATIMMLSPAGISGEVSRCRKSGIASYLIKPVRESMLLQAILVALGKAPKKDAVAESFDCREALDRVGNDPEILRDVIGVFLECGEKTAVQMREALDAGDARGVERTAHSLMGSLGNISAKPARGLAATLEQQAKGARLADAHETFVLLRGEMDRLQGALKTWAHLSLAAPRRES